MIPRLNDGEVAVGTDTGHSGTDLIFGWGHRDRIIDFGYRAVHETTVAAKAITAAFYGEPAKWNYFSGCSTGGYQGLSEAQRSEASRVGKECVRSGRSGVSPDR